MFSPETARIRESLRSAFEAGRMAPALLIIGSPEGGGRDLAGWILQLLFCDSSPKPCGACANCRRVERGEHPDAHRLEPTKKSRIISIDQIRELLQAFRETAYVGPWKAALILFADRMNPESMNALLKTLEEPPAQSALILVTDQVQALLPTIVSRCHRINVGEPEAPPRAEWAGAVEAWLSDTGPRGAVTALARANRLVRILDDVKARLAAEDEISEMEEEGDGAMDSNERAPEPVEEAQVSRDVREARLSARLVKERTEILKAIQLWQRDVLALKLGAPIDNLYFGQHVEILAKQAASATVADLYARIRAVDEAQSRLSANLNPLLVLDAMVRTGV